MQSLNNKKKLFDILKKGGIAITPNNRLSAALLRQYFDYSQCRTIKKPNCLPFTTAIVQAYDKLLFKTAHKKHPTLLNTLQSHYLWQTLIKEEAHIHYSDGLLQSVIQAWANCQLWNIKPDNPLFSYSPQTQQFQMWWKKFNKKLKDINAITEYQLIPYLLQVESPVFEHPIIWVSFDEFNPQQLTLQQSLETNGLLQYDYDLQNKNTTPQVYAAENNSDEYEQLIRWLDIKLQGQQKNIAVVIPNLQQESRFLHRLLSTKFDPDLFNISLGKPLTDFPLVAHALEWLVLENKHQCTPQQAALFLQSPYIGYAKEEFCNRSQFLQDSSLLQDQYFSVASLIHELNDNAPKLASILKNLSNYPEDASPQEWVTHFLQRLNEIGFPGDYGLNSENYQCLNRFTTLFDEFMQFHSISPNMSLEKAFELISQLCRSTIFQAQKTNAPIQISGLLEASGCEFESLWVMGLNDQCLPQKTRLSPFIPPPLQKQLQMPHSLPERELHFAQQTLKRLQNGSNELVFSYSQLQGDTPNLPCSLITKYPHYKKISVVIDAISSPKLIEQDDVFIIPKISEEHSSGGTALLANQAKCPFKAFAEHRLRAKPTPLTVDGLDPKERGTVIHKVMELIWQKLGSQKELHQLSTSDLEELLHQSILTALNPLSQLHPDSFPFTVKEIEITRLKKIILSCLEWEKKRPEFNVIGLEQSYSLDLAGIEFKVRVDRLDQVGEKKWVIDYKSSLPASKPWQEERPKKPQLLLYALLDEEINALLLLQLKSGKVLSSGFSEEKQVISGFNSPKKDETWEAYRQQWKDQLTLLADEFQNGLCQPMPSSPSLCQQCDFQNLCRYQVND